PRYLSFSLMTYFENMWPGHNGGGWFDTFDTHITEHYLEQAYLTAFSRPKEMMMFCFQSLYDNMYTAALGFQLDKLDALLDHAGQPVGIVCYLPDNSQGEDNVQDFLGMNGLPIVCSPYFPEKAEQILLTRASACDPDILDKLQAFLAKGGTAVVTSGFHEAMADRGIYHLSSIRMRGRRITANRYRVESMPQIRENGEYRSFCLFPWSDKPITVPVVEFRNNSTWAVVKASREEESFGLLLKDPVGKGRMWTLTVPDAFPDFYHYPTEAISRIREEFPVQDVWLEGPTRISLFVYDNDCFVLYPYVMEDVQTTLVRIHVKGAKELYIPALSRSVQPLYCKDGTAVFEVLAMPGRYVLYEIRR
ncbi:MAG TPA: hypothetical protein DCZ61_04065, partial [Lachnospiraceae bacterium]|nr:hypothetical protein [Lachnospiraceae bacterium]